MSGVARIMLARGIAVTGSDAKDVPVLAGARGRRGIASGWASTRVTRSGADAVVMSSSIRDDNVELVAARERGVPVLHRAQGLASLMGDRRPVAVAGANGKTTTTSLLTVALQGCGLDPSFAVGGELAKHGTNAHDGSDDIFVVEADESDGSFVVYHPEVAIVTNVQPDHLDFYLNFKVVEAAYDAFVGTIRPGGLLVTCADDAGARGLAERARSRGIRVVTYGFDRRGRRRARATTSPTGSRRPSTLIDRRATTGACRSACRGATTPSTPRPPMPPRSHGLGQDPECILAGLASFTGTRRRFEPKGEQGGVVVVDDYAHNAGKVAAVVETAKASWVTPAASSSSSSRTSTAAPVTSRASSARGWRRPTRSSSWTSTPRGRTRCPGVSGQLVADAVSRARPAARGALRPLVVGRRRGVVVDLARPGDLVLTVGAGDVTMVGPEVLRLLRGAP